MMTQQQIKKSKIYSPGLIGGDIVNFLESGLKEKFYITQADKEGFLKDENNKYVLFDLSQVIDARMLYLSSYLEKEKEDKINEEIESIKKELVNKATKTIDEIQRMEYWLDDRTYIEGNSALKNMLLHAIDSMEVATPNGLTPSERRREYAKLYFKANPQAVEAKEKLSIMIKENDYVSLYRLFNIGKPSGVFNINGDLTALINTIGANNIENTIEKMKEDPLYLDAKIRVEQKYFPQN